MRGWATRHRYGNVTTPQFIALGERESGQDLGRFFEVWLYQDAKTDVLLATGIDAPRGSAAAQRPARPRAG
jgi:aminopeptidase N